MTELAHVLENMQHFNTRKTAKFKINPLNAKLNPICHLLALLRAHYILHISRIRVKYTEWLSSTKLNGFRHVVISHHGQCPQPDHVLTM